MSSFPKSLNLFFLAVTVFFASCANDNPETSLVDHKIVYEFNDAESAPEVRLSVFVSVESDVKMGSSMKLVHEESGLEWYCKAPLLNRIELENMKWVGCTNFVPVKKELFPKGEYKIIYEDLAERECESSFSLYYPDEIKEFKVQDIPESFKTPATKKIAVYSNEDVLLYFGEEPASWQSNSDVLMDYKNAWCTRVCYTMNRNSVYCLMPPVELGNTDFVKEPLDESKSESN